MQNMSLSDTFNKIEQVPKNLMNPLYPARVISEKRNKSQLTGDTNPHPLFYDEDMGLYLKPVTNTMLDVEDLIYNKQFLKLKENEDNLINKFKSIHEKRLQMR